MSMDFTPSGLNLGARISPLTLGKSKRRCWLLNLREIVQLRVIWVSLKDNAKSILEMWISNPQVDSTRRNLGCFDPIIDNILNLRIAVTCSVYGISGICSSVGEDVCGICPRGICFGYARSCLTKTQGEQDNSNKQIHGASRLCKTRRRKHESLRLNAGLRILIICVIRFIPNRSSFQHPSMIPGLGCERVLELSMKKVYLGLQHLCNPTSFKKPLLSYSRPSHFTDTREMIEMWGLRIYTSS